MDVEANQSGRAVSDGGVEISAIHRRPEQRVTVTRCITTRGLPAPFMTSQHGKVPDNSHSLKTRLWLSPADRFVEGDIVTDLCVQLGPTEHCEHNDNASRRSF